MDRHETEGPTRLVIMEKLTDLHTTIKMSIVECLWLQADARSL